MQQVTNNILMIRPVSFRMNEQTAVNNYYQKVLDNLTPEMVQKKALKEFKDLVIKLDDVGVNVIVVKDTDFPDTPDSIFPNNWVSFHASGKICLFPMYAENRRVERRKDIFDTLKYKYFFLVNDIIDLTYFEKENKFQEVLIIKYDAEHKGGTAFKLGKAADFTAKLVNYTLTDH